MTDRLERLTAEDGKSLDLEAKNIEQLKQIFPDVFREDKVDFNALKGALGEHVVDKEERYNFTWHGKNKARQIAQTPSTGTLRPCKEESLNWDSTQNLFIEGDNLEVLKLLQKSYHKKVKIIYIDPPYNTGKDFVYKDNFQDNMKNYLELTSQIDFEGNELSANSETSGRFHTDWLNMMYPRLKLARNLLADDGVIFISIDDNEVSNLRKICDEIFGEDNFVANVVWQKKFSRSNDATYFSTMHDHILCYAKQSKTANTEQAWNLNLLPRGEEIPKGYSNPDNDVRGVWTSVILSAKSGTDKLKYSITTPSGRECAPPDGRYWSVNQNRFNELVKDNRIWFGKNGDGTPRLKTFLSEVQDGIRPNSMWFHTEVGHNQEGRQEVKALFDDKGYFDGPKPTRLLENILKIASANKDFLVLDFFAGSSTTAHAVMKLNNEDQGNRRFIMVQLPELLSKKSEAYKAGYKTIADISKDRIRRASKQISLSENYLSSNDIGYKVLKLDSTNIKQWEPSFDKLSDIIESSAESIKSDRSSEDVLYEILIKYGLDLSYPITKHNLANKSVYEVAFGSLIVCLDENISIETVAAIGKLKQELDSESTRVVFKDVGFADDAVKVNAVQLLKQYGIDDVKSI